METIMEAVHLMESKKSDEAIALLEDYLPIADEEERFTIAELFIQWGFLEEASNILQDLLQQYPHESDIKITLADIYIELENDEKAIQLLNDISEDDESYLQALIQLADLYQAQGLFEVAEQKLLVAKQLNPAEPIIDFALGELLFSTGDYLKAITYYERIIGVTKEMANVSIPGRLAESYAAIGEYEQALAIYQDTGHEDPDTLFKYGLTAFQAGRKDISIKAWEHVIDIDPYYHTVYYQLAKAYEAEELPNEAYKTAKKGLQVDEFNKELFFYAGSLAYRLNENKESEKWMRQAIALDPDYKEAILSLIEILKANDSYSDIIDLIEEIKKTGASDPLYEWELARAYNETDSYKNALNHYQEAYNTLNKDSEFLKEYAYFLTEEGRIADALPIFKAYLYEQPEDYEVEEFYHRLDDETDR
ncbi:tetratricopeptide repeat protein [Lentibacillus sp. N15]|uniref:tetratricopeptide repeat protein n=1 Tax=Lentibacillus songyuanensis TaxID=3136161 RepID=UPI0031BAA116